MRRSPWRWTSLLIALGGSLPVQASTILVHEKGRRMQVLFFLTNGDKVPSRFDGLVIQGNMSGRLDRSSSVLTTPSAVLR